MTEGFNPASAPVRRGRRDPELAQALGMEDEPVSDDSDSPPLLYEGDRVNAKATVDILIDGRSNWFTYEAETRVGPGEDESDANDRVELVVTNRVMQLADTMEEKLTERAVEKSRRRITPR